MDGPFLGVSAISFCLPGFWLYLGALCIAVAHLHFVYLHSLWIAEVAFVTGIILCLTGSVGAYGSTRRYLWPISVFVGAAFAVLSLEAAIGVVFICQWNLVEEMAKEHDQTGALLLLLRCIEAHPVITSWILGSFFILQVSTLFLAAHHAFDISMDTEEPEEESMEEGERQDEKAPLLLAYEQVYLPKPSKQASKEEDGSHCQSASQKNRASRRCKVPEWRDVLLTAALLWLAATGLILIIAMVKVGMYQGPGLGHHAMHEDENLKHALTKSHAASQSLMPPALDSLSAQPDSKEDRRHGKEGHADKARKHDGETEADDDEGDDDDDIDDKDDDHHHKEAAEEHSHKKERHDQHRKEEEGDERAHRKKSHSDDDDDDDDDSEDEDEDSHLKRSKAKGSNEDHSDKDADDEDGDEDEQEGSEQAAGELGKKPWKKHHHHKKHKKHRRHCEDEEPSCQEGAPRWFAGVLGVVGVPMLVLSSVAAAGVWCGLSAVLHMFAGASAVFLASEVLLMHIVLNHSPILVTAADFDYSNGLQHTLDFALEHTIVTPLLIIALLACQAGAMVAAANFGMPIPVRERVITASAQLRDKVEDLNLPEKAAVLYHQGREKSAAAAVSIRAAVGRAAERAGFPAVATRIAAGSSIGDAGAGNAAGDHAYTAVAAAAEDGAVDVASQDGSTSGSESKDPWASLRRALHPEGTQHTVRWSDED